MQTDFISTETRRQGSLTFAMKKRPSSGDVTYILTLNDDVYVIASRFKDGLCSPKYISRLFSLNMNI